MIALFIGLALAEPLPEAKPIVAPDRVESATLIEPILELLPARTQKLVQVPGTALLEWGKMGEVELGSFVDIWTRSPKGVCLAAPRVEVVLGPKATGDLRYSVPVVRVPAADHARLQGLKYAGWTPRRADDPREYKELWCK